MEIASAASQTIDVRQQSGGASVRGDVALGYRINLWSRIAGRVLRRGYDGSYRHEQDIYDQTLAQDWSAWFDVKRAIAVNVNARRANLKSLDFITLRIKDAICDRFRQQSGTRPNVDVRMPDVRISAFFDDQRFTLYIDTSGDALHVRGWRIGGTATAPLKENLAAGIVRLSGWQPEQPLLDPMCGGGTLLIEAAQLALRHAPGLNRRFGFQALADFDAALWEDLCAQARAAVFRDRPLAIYGADRDATTLRGTKRNLTAAGVADVVQLRCADALELTAPAPAGVLISNPPYGVRQSEQSTLRALYPRIGDWLKQNFTGWRASIFTADLELAKLIGLRPSRRVPLYNGALECRLFVFEIVSGSMRDKPKRSTAQEL